jgi:hypothetical protein
MSAPDPDRILMRVRRLELVAQILALTAFLQAVLMCAGWVVLSR